MATLDPVLPPRQEMAASRLHVVRKPSLRVRQAVRDNNTALLARLQHKMDLRNTDRMRLTSLAWAALESHVEVFEWLLLDYGHDDQELSRDAEHNTIFHLLAASTAPLATTPFADLFMSSPDFPPRPPSKAPAELMHSCHRMTEVYYTLFPFLVDWSNTSGKTALHIAAQANNADFLNQLCDLGADVSLVDIQGNTPLHYASAWGHVESIRVLLERGGNVALRNFEGFTAAEYAYSSQVRTALDAIARDVLEERRARKREERMMQKERERAEREMYERGRELREREDDMSGRLRSGSGSTAASGISGSSSFSHTPYPRGDEPPLPPLPPDVAQAAAAAARARLERRATERMTYATHGSPTPQATRHASDTTVPTFTLSPTPTPSNNPRPQNGSPTPMRSAGSGGYPSTPRSNLSSGGPSPTSTVPPFPLLRHDSQPHAL